MSESFYRPTTRDEERELHRRLLKRDVVATAELAIAYLEPLVRWIQARNPGIDEHFWTAAADEAILALIRNPKSYRPDKNRLEAYLRMSAQGDLRNLLRKERKHQKNRKPWNVVELDDESGKYLGVDDPPLVDQTDSKATFEVADGEVERQMFELMKNGERRTSEFAKVCNVAHLSKEEQERAVKRVKDRLKRRLQRARRTK